MAEQKDRAAAVIPFSADSAESGNGVESAAAGREVLLKRLLAKATTQELWTWLGVNPNPNWKMRPEIASELVDRLGWGAWNVAMDTADAKTRSLVADLILYQLSTRDPWKGYELWKQHKGEFGPDWAQGAIDEAQTASAHTSAEALIDVFKNSAVEESEFTSTITFAGNFDFKAALDYLWTADRLPGLMPENLLSSWGQRDPVDAVNWLMANPGYVDAEHHQGMEADMHRSDVIGLLRNIAYQPLDTPGRAEALEALGNLPADFLAKAWSGSPSDFKDKISGSALEAATAMGQRDVYLSQVLNETHDSDALDPSWQQVPMEDRAELMEKVEATWPPLDQLTPVKARQRERWRNMVTTAWKIGQ